MKTIQHLTVSLLIVASALSAAELKPLMLERGTPIVDEAFAGNLNTNTWGIAIGAWSASNGVLIGKERPDDRHAAVIKTAFSNTNAIIQFSFMLVGTSSFSFSVNDPTGHNSRVMIKSTDINVRKDADKKNARTFSAVLDDCGAALKTNTWYTMLVEMKNDEMLARIDDTVFVLGTHSGINRDKKDVGFPVNGEVWFDNFRMWNAVENKGWKDEKQKLLARTNARPAPDRSANPQDAYSVAESKARLKLMQNDAAFVALVDARAALTETLEKKFPIITKKGDKADAERKRLAKEDETYKKMQADLRAAQTKEREYLFSANPQVKALFDAFVAAQKEKAKKPKPAADAE